VSDIAKMLSTALNGHDAQRDRSLQKDIGPSSVGDCARRVYYYLTNQPKLNETDSLAAIMGTFIHAGIAESIKREDPFGDNFLIEQEFAFDGLRGHVDLYIKDKKQVVDWKTTKKKSLRYFPSNQQRMQVHLYGWLLTNNGYEVDKVTLVAIARDGLSEDIKEHTETYDENMALSGLDWLRNIREMAENKTPPPPEKDVSFCRSFCNYYDATGVNGCQGK
jgi:CRISPR/Cas system-associated exonuclease Cas4 (RecB family)